ncbi:hypothetical protein [Allomuricauda sp. SCSIO 65647]|uniref:hypothetical protein n=1 Tax=Allomuricauda sp. SCSIO 65647 TaxID=2908843 RepID=UPI001F405E74|nr:hypothetical protein [Muricauda sp. SCSIO 65647]UJH67680.1 hypothetical protein L0P89_00330 [Muricauda sp. SCSIO 65647]
MMKFFFTLFTVLFISSYNYSQTQDLIALSLGQYVGFDVILDEDRDVYGYVSIYAKDEVDETNKAFEAVLLDRNLNKVSNLEFLASNTIDSFQAYMNPDGQIIFLPFAYGYYFNNYKYSDMLEVDFKLKETKPYKLQCYKENGSFEDCKTYQTFKEKRKDDKRNFKEKGYIYDSDVYEIRNDYSLILDRKRYKKFYDDVTIKVFDDAKEKKWEKIIDSTGSQKGFMNVDMFWKNLNKSKNVYTIISRFDRGDASSKYLSSYENVYNTKHWSKIAGFNIETGEQVLDEDISGKYVHTSDVLARMETDDHLIDVRVLNNGTGSQIGFRRTKIGLKDNTIEWDDLLFESMIGKIDRLNKYGAIGGNYKLNPIASFVNQDGSVYILTEEYKSAYNVLWGYTVNKNKDFFLIRTTPDFTLESIDRIEKDKSKYAYTDFLFWQRLSNENNDIAFFYTDKRQGEEEKQKYRILGVCTIIDGEFNREELTIESRSEEFVIVPSVAKRGYIMLHEFNKKEDYNAVRLERLNY